MGKQRLISEVLAHLVQHGSLPARYLAPSLQGYGLIPLQVSRTEFRHHFWESLGIPLQPALQITVTVPLGVMRSALANAG